MISSGTSGSTTTTSPSTLYIDVEPLGRISVNVDDSTLKLGFHYPAPEKPWPLGYRGPKGYGQLAAAKAWLARFGIRLDTTVLQCKMNRATEESAQLAATIAAVEAP